MYSQFTCDGPCIICNVLDNQLSALQMCHSYITATTGKLLLVTTKIPQSKINDERETISPIHIRMYSQLQSYIQLRNVLFHNFFIDALECKLTLLTSKYDSYVYGTYNYRKFLKIDFFVKIIYLSYRAIFQLCTTVYS